MLLTITYHVDDFAWLQGIIDANVMGGISKYQQAFFTPEFSKQFPEFEDHVYRLKTLTLDQVRIVIIFIFQLVKLLSS
jgi:hypothetical protein